MAYDFTIRNGFKVKKDGTYPCPTKNNPNQTVKLFTDDVLTKEDDDKYMRHTGIGRYGIVLTDDEVEPIKKPVKLRVM